jgi:hypothetical protein
MSSDAPPDNGPYRGSKHTAAQEFTTKMIINYFIEGFVE